MSNLKDYLSDTKYIQLNSVKYTNLNTEIKSKPELNCFDNFECNYKEKAIEIKVTRYVNFTPKCLFSAEISYSIIHKFDESKYKGFNKDDFDLQKIVESDLDYYVPDEMDRVSLLISQITDAFEGRPLITSPHFLFNEDV